MKSIRKQAGFFGEIASSIVGGLFGQIGSDSRNRAQVASAREQMEFQAREAQINRQFEREESRRQRIFNRQEAGKARNTTRNLELGGRRFEAHMSNTEIRRRMRDLRAGGINPILAAGQAASTPSAHGPSVAAATSGKGSAPSTPGGAQAQIEDSVGKGLATARQASLAKSLIEQQRQQVAQSKAAAKLIENQAKTESERTHLTRQQAQTEEMRTAHVLAQTHEAESSTARNAASVPNLHADTHLKGRQADSSSASAEHTRTKNRLDRSKVYGAEYDERIDRSQAGQAARWANKLGPIAASALGTIGGIGIGGRVLRNIWKSRGRRSKP